MGLELRTEQQLRISQKLLESLEILQMNEEQLFRYLSDVAESNPVIDFSWDDFSDHARKPVTDDPGKTEFIDNISDPAQDTETFQDYLQLQIHWDRYCEPDSRILSYLIDNLDDNGYFRQDTDQVAKDLHVNGSQVMRMLKVIQSLDPIGTGAQSLSECLLIQLRKCRNSDLAQRIVTDELDNLAKKHYAQIAENLHTSVENVERSCRQITELNPLPANSFRSCEKTVYIRPDVIVSVENGQIRCSMSGANLKFEVNDEYSRLFRVTNDREAKKFLKEKIGQVHNISKLVEKRNETLRKIMEVVIERQSDFFLSEGAKPCLSLSLNDIADALKLNPSTICRAIQNKYVECASGTYPMKWFLKRAMHRSSESCHADVSDAMVKTMISEFIKGESKDKPYSDARLADLICQQGIKISRRTVNKYRSLLMIPDQQGRRNIYRTNEGGNGDGKVSC